MGSLGYAVAGGAALLLVAAAAPLRADPLSDLRLRLSSLRAQSPARGTAEYQLSTRTRDGSDVRTEEGRIRVSWEHSSGALKLGFSDATLEEAEREQRARRADPDRTAPTRTTLFNFTALQIAEAIDFATILLRELETGKLLDARRAGDQMVLTMELPPLLGRTERKHVRDEEVRMTIWIGADGLPTAAERTIRIRARFFFIRIDNNRTDRWSLSRHDDRLIVNSHEEEEVASGMTRSVTTRSTLWISVE